MIKEMEEEVETMTQSVLLTHISYTDYTCPIFPET